MPQSDYVNVAHIFFGPSPSKAKQSQARPSKAKQGRDQGRQSASQIRHFLAFFRLTTTHFFVFCRLTTTKALSQKSKNSTKQDVITKLLFSGKLFRNCDDRGRPSFEFLV
jgi:hypothetical protein